MILRRLARRIREHDWFAILIELTVVVLGVFIGLQASNWNDDLAQERKAVVFGERLRQDLYVEAWAYERQVGYYSDVMANAEKAADALTGDIALDDEALLVAAYRATQYNSNTRRRATYDELSSTGEIGLIRDLSLRQLAMEVYSTDMFDIMVDEGIGSLYRAEFRRSLPHRVQRAVSDACGDRVVAEGDFEGVDDSLDYPCSTGLSPEVLAQSVATLRANPELLRLLRLRLLDVETSLFNLTIYYKGLRESLAALAQREKAATK